MIKHFYRSKSDIENLSRLRTVISSEIDKFDYRGVVVNKPWGYEYLMYDNQFVAVWALYLKHGYQTSMHCHPNKKTSLIVISGQVICSTLEGWLHRRAGQGVVIDEAVFHSTRADSRDGAFVIEVESPPNKKDLVRLKDEYGRQGQVYEGIAQMSQDLGKYEYIDLHNLPVGGRSVKVLRDAKFSIVHHDYRKDVSAWMREEKAHLLCLLQGRIHTSDGGILLSTGEAATVSQLRRRSDIISFSDIMSLTLSYGKYR